MARHRDITVPHSVQCDNKQENPCFFFLFFRVNTAFITVHAVLFSQILCRANV